MTSDEDFSPLPKHGKVPVWVWRPVGWCRKKLTSLSMLAHVLWMTLLGLLVTSVVAAGIWYLAGTPSIRSLVKDMSLLDLLRVALLVTGGIGGIVALVVTYRRQKLGERSERLENQAAVREERAEERENTKLFNERFATASQQLGGDNIMVKLAGIYAIATLAGDWEAGRQMCIDVLCAYIRKPFERPKQPEQPRPPEPMTQTKPPDLPTSTRVAALRFDPDRGLGLSEGEERDSERAYIEYERAYQKERLHDLGIGRYEHDKARFEAEKAEYDQAVGNFDAVQEKYRRSLEEQQIRATVFRVIRDHLVEGAPVGWQGYIFDFTGAVIEDCDFSGAQFYRNQVRFSRTIIDAERIDFNGSIFRESVLLFDQSRFKRGTIWFDHAKFENATLSFDESHFDRADVRFERPYFINSILTLFDMHMENGYIHLIKSSFIESRINLRNAHIASGSIRSRGTLRFQGSAVDTPGAKVVDGGIDLDEMFLVASDT